MSRIRSLKPEVIEDEHKVSLSDAAWRVMVSLWPFSDDHGGVRLGGKYVGATVFQDTTRDVEPLLAELVAKKQLQIYVVDGARYGRWLTWNQDQRIDNAGKPKVPPPGSGTQAALFPEPTLPPVPGSKDSNDLDEISPTSSEGLGQKALARAPAHPAAGREGKGREGNRKGTKDLSVLDPPYCDPDPAAEVYEHWLDCRQAHNPRRQRITISDKDRKALKALLKSGRSVEELKMACEGLFLSPFHLGENDRATAYLDFAYVVGRKNIEPFIALAEAARADRESAKRSGDVGPGTAIVSPDGQRRVRAILSELGAKRRSRFELADDPEAKAGE